MDFKTFAEEVARSAFTDKSDNVRRLFRNASILDVLRLNAQPLVLQMTRVDPVVDLFGWCVEYDNNEKKFPSSKKQVKQPGKICARCDKPGHSTMSCRLYFGTIPVSACKKCNQGRHFPNHCKQKKM